MGRGALAYDFGIEGVGPCDLNGAGVSLDLRAQSGTGGIDEFCLC